MRHTRAVVVGAGIGGPVMALWLRRMGVEPHVVEARPDRAGDGAFLGLAPNGLAAVEGLGLADRLEGLGHRCDGFSFLDRRGRELGAIDRSGDRDRFGHPLTMVRRADLHAELADACAEAGVRIGYGRPLVAVDERTDGVVARLGDGTALEADLLVGCDGLRSTTRRLCLPESPAPAFAGLLDFGGFVKGVDVPIPAGINAMVFGARAFFGAFRTADDEVWWFHNGPPTEEPLDAEGHRARLLELHAADVGWVGELIRATPAVLGPWRIHELRAMRRWWSGRVCLIGDAAHAMSPSAGQGASLAMEDAAALALCLQQGGADAFARFEAMRRPRVDAMFRAARRNGSGKAPGPIGAWFRDRILPWALRGAGEAQARGYAYRLTALPET